MQGGRALVKRACLNGVKGTALERSAAQNFQKLDPAAHARMASYADAYSRDGVVHIPGALDAGDLAIAGSLYEWSKAHPGQAVMDGAVEGGESFFMDTHNRDARGHYRDLLGQSTIPAIAAAVMDRAELWFLGEQLFVKEGTENTRGTPWHQDIDLPIDAAAVMGMWITFEPVSADDCLRFVRGSHRGPAFNPVVYSDDGTSQRLLFPAASHMPPFPDIKHHPENFDVVSWAYKPGDVILFNNMVIHGGGPVPPGGLRRSLVMRFFGAELNFKTQPERRNNGNRSVEGNEYLYEGLSDGLPLWRGKHFFKVFEEGSHAQA
jgi:ectoine hydroxylase-related dioxygenase (phytanoyl-CoA dioxygenase family)